MILSKMSDKELTQKIANVRQAMAETDADHSMLLSKLESELHRRRIKEDRAPNWYVVLQPYDGEVYMINGKPGVVRWTGGSIPWIEYEGKRRRFYDIWRDGNPDEVWKNSKGEILFGRHGLYRKRVVDLGYRDHYADKFPE